MIPASSSPTAMASRSMPRPMPMSHARRRTIAASASSTGSVASAHRMNPPRHGAASNGGAGSTSTRVRSAVGDRPLEEQLAVAPQARREARRRRRRGLTSYCRRAVPRAACATHRPARSNWCVHCQCGSDTAATAVQRSDSSMPTSCREVGAGVGARRPRPAAGVHRDAGDGVAVVGQRDLEVVEVVLEAAPHRRGVDAHEPDAASVGERGIAGADGRRARRGASTAPVSVLRWAAVDDEREDVLARPDRPWPGPSRSSPGRRTRACRRSTSPSRTRR